MVPRIGVVIAGIVLLVSAPALRASDVKAIPDVEVTDQHGRSIRFYSDLVKDKPVVLVTFLFTTCDAICPRQGARLAQLQTSLGDRLGREISLIAVSVDPATDTPERLQAWAARFGVRPGWTLVTGPKPAIDSIALAFTGAVAVKGEHSPVVFVGNAEKGKWIRAYGLSSLESFDKIIEAVREAPVR